MSRRNADGAERLREAMLVRDGGRCVACGVWQARMTLGHRQAKGAGGRGAKAPQLTLADVVTLCFACNEGAENTLQQMALAGGWKVRRNTVTPLDQVPVRYWNGGYYLLSTEGHQRSINAPIARAILERVNRI